MPSFQDSAVIFFIALLLFGPKKLPELARQLGKLMGEFRRASNEFRMQMEDELRVSDQAEKQKQIAAIEAAAPVAPAIGSGETSTIAPLGAEAPAQPGAEPVEDPYDTHPHLRPPDRYTTPETSPSAAELPAPIPISTSGDLSLMPPATGLPVARSAAASESSVLSPMFESIPQAPDRNGTSHSEHTIAAPATTGEALSHG